jgi:hypothetical protein
MENLADSKGITSQNRFDNIQDSIFRRLWSMQFFLRKCHSTIAASRSELMVFILNLSLPE